MIVIAGDSWSVGEWDQDLNKITHSGLEQYLSEDGHAVCNIGASGNSNAGAVQDLRSCLNILKSVGQTVDRAFVFQTEWHRDFNINGISLFELLNRDARLFNSTKLGNPIDEGEDYFLVHNISTPQDLEQCITRFFYQKLSSIAQEYSVDIQIIGGCADANECNYSGVQVACNSMTNLIMEQNNSPVSSYYFDIPLQNWMRQQFPNKLGDLMELYERGMSKLDLMKQNPKWFWPDGRHPNRDGHRILYEFLKTKNII
jgi:hypothetical protein